jgi:hypothetical protein
MVSFSLDLSVRAFLAVVNSMGTTTLALGGAVLIWIVERSIEHQRTKATGVKSGIFATAERSIFLIAIWWSALFLYQLVYRIPHDIITQAKTVGIPSRPPVPAPPEIQKIVSSPVDSAQPYPWIDLRELGRLYLRVRDYPTPNETRAGILGLSSLFNVQVIVTSPIAVIPTMNAWHSCVIVPSQHFSEWNNGNGSLPLGTLKLDTDVTVLEMRVTARNGIWNATAILKRDGSYDESIIGNFSTADGHNRMTLRETSSGSSMNISDSAPSGIELTKKLLISLGLPTIQLTKDQLDSRCPQGSVFTARVTNGIIQ